MSGDRQLYNVTVRAVDLVYATSEEDAIGKVTRLLNRAGVEVLPDGRDAFVSEPVPEMGWDG